MAKMLINNIGCMSELGCRWQKMAPSISYYRNVQTSFAKNGWSGPGGSTAIFLNDFIHSMGCIGCFPYNPCCVHEQSLEFLSLRLDVLVFLPQGYGHIPK
jgi:hypothetical protein